MNVREHLGFGDMVTLRMSLYDRLDNVRRMYGADSEAEQDLRRLTETLGLNFEKDVL